MGTLQIDLARRERSESMFVFLSLAGGGNIPPLVVRVVGQVQSGSGYSGP